MKRHMLDSQKYRATSGKRNFKERIKAPIFLEPVLAIRAHIQFKRERQPYPNILKHGFSSRTDPSSFTSETKKKRKKTKKTNKLSFSSTEINKPLPAPPVHSVL